MSANLSRDHTLTPSWRAKDAHGRNITFNARPGTLLSDACRPSYRLEAHASDTSRKIILPSTSVEQPLEMERLSGHSPLRAVIASGAVAVLAHKVQLARAMAVQLARVHACNILHANVSLDSFLIDPTCGSLAIIDFLGAVQLAPDTALEGSVAHGFPEALLLTPEGAKHSDLPIDHRADLYTLGCAFYELFAGRPVFPITNRSALRHAHLAKLAPRLGGVVAVPAVLSDIVMALINKQADERYQRAANLVVDLNIVCAALEGPGELRPFPLRLRSRSAALAEGEFLYGRDQQQSRLLEAFTAARAGHAQTILVTGLPGIGKSALCRQIARDIGKYGARAAIGKFEQLETNAPYHGIVRCFEALIDQILTESSLTAGVVALNLTRILNENLAILANILPNLRYIIDVPVSQEPLSGAGGRDRLAQCFLGFLQSAASAETPVVLFFDDLQWADSASMDLLRGISAGLTGHVLMVGLSRTERDTPGLLAGLADVLKTGTALPNRLDLIALTRSDVEDLLTGIFGPKQNQRDAAGLIYAKTLGVPLSIAQFLNKIGDDAVLDQSGIWDIGRIADLEGAADIADFLSARIRSLDEPSRRILATAACFGMSFELKSLRELVSIADAALHDRLGKLVGDGFLVPAGDVYLFAHDRVREAAYALAVDREIIHRTIGQRLLALHDGERLPDHAYTIASHLKAAGDLSDAPGLADRYLRVTHLAAQRAHDAAAFDIARGYAETALNAAGADRWARDYASMAATLLVKANSTVSQHDHGRFDAEYEADFARLLTNEHRLQFALVRVMSLNARALCEEAIAVGLNGLRLIGIEIPDDPDRQREMFGRELAVFQEALAGRSPDCLFAIAPLEDACIAMAMQVLFRLAPNAHATTKLELFALMAVRNANLLMRHGRDAQASGIVMTLALVMARATGDLHLADHFGRVALQLDVREGRRSPPSVSFVYAYFFSHWLHPLEASLAANLDGMRTGYELGDVQFGSFHAAAYVIHLASAGAPLPEVVRAGREHERLIAGRVKVASFHCQLETAFAHALLGMTAAETSLSEDAMLTVDAVLQAAAEMAQADRGFYLARHLQLTYIFCDLEAAQRYADAALAALPGIAGNFVEAEVITFSLLTELAVGGDRTERFASGLACLRRWAELNPANFGCRLSLVLAELARLDAHSSVAIAHYGHAMRDAKRHRFLHMAALAAERAARFYFGIADEIAGSAYLGEAVALYGEWGAQAKVLTLREELCEAETAMASGPVDGGESELEGALLGAARAISAEIDLERLLQQVMTSVQEISGATYGALILGQETGYFVEVVARHGEPVMVSEASIQPLADSPLVPRSVIASVQREGVTLVLRNAGASAFARDPYIRGNGVVSVLCAPLSSGGKLDGFIYLENNLTVGSFGPQLEQAVQVLAAQAAIALANARLFALLNKARSDLASANEDLERKIDRRTDELARAHAVALEKAAEAERARQAERDANEAKSRFLSVVSHEIRTPMNGVLGMLQLLEQERLDAKARRQVAIARESGLTLVKLIDGVLDYSRLELGADAVRHEPFELRRLIENSVEIFRPDLEARGIAFGVDIDAPDDVVLRSDARAIARVIMNLVGNAAKFTAAGEITVKVTLGNARESEAAMLSLSVRDTGVGIAKEMQDRIFGEFVQADSSVKRRHSGTGLGLAICSRIISLLDGTITVSSGFGSGSVFVATIPVLIGSALHPAIMPAPTKAPLSLLIVDDDATNLEVTSGLLRHLGHAVLCADGSVAAVAAVACRSFDALILDLHMPGFDGLETAGQIRTAMGTRPCPPIIILTADVTEASRRLCFEHGIAHILPKPLRLDTLCALLAGLSATAQPPARRDVPATPIDRLLFGERCDLLGIAQMVRLTRQHRRSARETIRCISRAVLAADRRTVARLAHRMRSASGALYLIEMEALAHRLEAAALTDGLPLDHHVGELEHALQRSVAAVITALRMQRARQMASHPLAGSTALQPRRSTSTPSR